MYWSRTPFCLRQKRVTGSCGEVLVEGSSEVVGMCRGSNSYHHGEMAGVDSRQRGGKHRASLKSRYNTVLFLESNM